MDSQGRKKQEEPMRSSKGGTKNVVGKASLRLMRTMTKAIMERASTRKAGSSSQDQIKVVMKEDERSKGERPSLVVGSMRSMVTEGRPSNVQEDEKRVVEAEMEVERQRKSMSEVEINVESVAAFANVIVRAVDMPPFMQAHAFRCARRAYDGSQTFSTRHMAFTMKKEFDKIYGPAWHCIVGSSFGSYVTHATGCFIYFSVDQVFILLFKTKVQRVA